MTQLQAAINIINHYGRRYRLTFGADKTKVTVTGSAHDMRYYKEIPFWKLNGDYLSVTDDNEHLGLIVSGTGEECKNIDKNLTSARNTLLLSWVQSSHTDASSVQLYNPIPGGFMLGQY